MNALSAIASIQARGGDIEPPPTYSLAARVLAVVMIRHGIGRSELARRNARMQPCKRAAVSALRTIGLSLPETAAFLGAKDHTSALYHERRCTPEDHLRALEAICDAMGEP